MSTPQFPFSLCATAIGSMPHTDPQVAARVVLQALPDLPAWPQLYQRSPLEHMAPQFAEGITGSRIEEDRVILEGMPGEHDSPLLTVERAAGFHALLEADLSGVKGLKGQVTGPLTFAHLVAMDDGGRAEEDLRVARRLAHLLGRLAEWQEIQLRRRTRNTLIMLDEPLLDRALENRRIGPAAVLDLLASTFIWVKGMRGLHSCAPPDWAFLLNLPMQVISFDAYRYGDTTEMAASGIRSFLARGGAIAWGVVPADQPSLDAEHVDSLVDLMARTWGRLVDLGVPRELLERQSMFTPSCGLANLTPQGAEKALTLTSQVAAHFRRGAGQSGAEGAP